MLHVRRTFEVNEKVFDMNSRKYILSRVNFSVQFYINNNIINLKATTNGCIKKKTILHKTCLIKQKKK